MKRAPAFLTVENVLAIHARMIREFGGDPGLRDRRLLESAVAMPAAGSSSGYFHKTLADQAAAYLFHLCRDHPFLDANKRTALGAAEVFLRLNGRRLAATNEELEELTRGVADGSTAKRHVLDFFRVHVRR